jgi:hypothetical protein
MQRLVTFQCVNASANLVGVNASARIVNKSLPQPVGVFSMLPNPSKCHIRPPHKKTRIFIIKYKIP